MRPAAEDGGPCRDSGRVQKQLPTWFDEGLRHCGTALRAVCPNAQVVSALVLTLRITVSIAAEGRADSASAGSSPGREAASAVHGPKRAEKRWEEKSISCRGPRIGQRRLDGTGRLWIRIDKWPAGAVQDISLSPGRWYSDAAIIRARSGASLSGSVFECRSSCLSV